MSQYIKLGKVDDLADGRAMVVEVEGQQIAIFHVGEHFYALEASCPHEGGPLADGVIEGLHVVCPWHAYDFHLKTGECGLDPDLRALTYPVKVQNGDLFIEMA